MADPTVITEPGVYELDEDVYHRDPIPGGSLSASGAKRLLPPSCPAKFAYARSHPAKPKRAFDVGHAAHSLTLGVGKSFVLIDAEEWRSNAVKAEVQAVRDAGSVPLRPSDFEAVYAMAQALDDSKEARRLFANGWPEQSLFAPIERPGELSVWGRGRLDFLPVTPDSGRMIVPDYKTASDASKEAFSKAAASFGYYRQAAWYLRLLAALGISNDAAFVFVVQEVEPPYLVGIHQLDDDAMLIGNAEMDQALDIYAECSASGVWPGYDDEVNVVSLPRWKTYAYQESQ